MANYYPIKCPYCLKSHTNETVRFNIMDAVVTSSKAAKKASEGGFEPEPEESGYITQDVEDWTESSEPAAAPSGNKRSRAVPTDGYYTLSELKAIFGADRIKIQGKTVHAMPALTGEEYSGDLLMSVTYVINEDGKEVERTMHDRYCDCDEGRKFSMSSGSVPSYVVLLMGSSHAGKTMYLISLYHALSRKGGYSLPPTNDPGNAVANLSLTVLSEGGSETSIARMTDDLFDNGILPRTTFEMTNEPLTMYITVNFNRAGLKKEALLFFRDMPGENLTNREKQQELLKITGQFPRFDGFMMMFDPLTFEESVFPSMNPEKDREQRRQVGRLREVIIERIKPIMANNTISQPTSVIITKGDKFFDRRHTRALMNKGIQFANPLLAAMQTESFDKSYFDEVNNGAHKILKCLSNNIAELVGAHFNNAFFTMTSAINRNPIDIDEANEKVSSPSAINPWRVTDPMLRLLMKMSILPPFDETEVRRKTGESEAERSARIFKNRSIINEWGKKYCTGASNVNII